MNDVFSLLLVIGLFFLMMRYGCGAHAGHRRHRGPGDGEHSHQH